MERINEAFKRFMTFEVRPDGYRGGGVDYSKDALGARYASITSHGLRGEGSLPPGVCNTRQEAEDRYEKVLAEIPDGSTVFLRRAPHMMGDEESGFWVDSRMTVYLPHSGAAPKEIHRMCDA